MNLKLRKLALMLTIATILLSLSLPNMKIAISEGHSGKIDLFTQKEPYSGKGPNTPSDAFGPQEHVILYAFVNYNEMPIQNLLVAFHVQNPSNNFFSFSERTNSSGIATVNFTISWPCENVSEDEVFGEWYVLASAVVGVDMFQDSLTFKVGWVVELVSARTVDENLTYRANFGIEGDVGLEITLKSIAMAAKTATIAIVIQDELNFPISFSEISDFKVQPNEKLVFLYCKLYIPKWAHVGQATVFVSALTPPTNVSGVPYCPSISTNFYIMVYEPLAISFHDVSVVEVVPSANSVETGQIVNIQAAIQNEGTENESFSVNAYYNASLIQTFSTTLAPHSNKILNFTFNTTGVTSANYTISVSIPYLVNEADLSDNTFLDGIVEVKAKPSLFMHHDVAVLTVLPSLTFLYVGEVDDIYVVVKNQGNFTESFNVTLFYDGNVIDTRFVEQLEPNVERMLHFSWNTQNVTEGNYTLSALASVILEEENLENNICIDGFVEVKALVHDIAVINIVPSSTIAYIGEILSVNVTLKNKGSRTESFNVTLYYNSNVIATLSINSLPSNTAYTVIFHWNTNGVVEGNYTLSAFAELVPGEQYTEDNYLENGVVEVIKGAMGWFVPEWFWWLLLLLLLTLVFLLIWLYLRRRKKKSEEAFRSGWTAWYYCYDLRKIRKV